MPSEKVLELKKQQVAALKERLDASIAGVIVDYKGITVADDTALRKELREAGVEYTVVKNTLLGRAIEGTSLADMGSVLEGTTAIATSKDDYVAAARILGKFAEKNDNFTVKVTSLKIECVALVSILSKNSCCCNIVILTCSDSCCTLKGATHISKACSVDGTTENCVLYNCVFNTCFTELFTKLCIVFNADTLVVNYNTCD